MKSQNKQRQRQSSKLRIPVLDKNFEVQQVNDIFPNLKLTFELKDITWLSRIVR